MPDENQDDFIKKIIADIGTKPPDSKFDFYKSAQEKSKQTETLEEKENGDILEMRRSWSSWILFFIGVVITFDMVLVILYGSRVLKFDDPRIVIVVITDNFLKIVGLGFLITTSIFKKIYRN